MDWIPKSFASAPRAFISSLCRLFLQGPQPGDWVVELVGLKGPTTQSSNRSPPCAGNGNFLRRDRPAKAGSSSSRDRFRDTPEARKPDSCARTARLLAKV